MPLSPCFEFFSRKIYIHIYKHSMDISLLPLESLCLKVMGYLSLGMKAKANIKFHGETIIMAHPHISFFFIFFGLLSMLFQNVKKFRHSFYSDRVSIFHVPLSVSYTESSKSETVKLSVNFPDIIQFFCELLLFIKI